MIHPVNADTLKAESILENITHTLLYEGYALYPYHRSAIKNQKPIPFGVVFPEAYHAGNVHAHSTMQTQAIIKGIEDFSICICVRFLHLKKIHLFEYADTTNEFVPVDYLDINQRTFQAGWQTIERKVNTGDVQISQLVNNKKTVLICFDKILDTKNIYDEAGKIAAKQIDCVLSIKGSLVIEAAAIENTHNAFRITVNITNTTHVENAETISRDEILSQSFLSTHIILQTNDASFISHQNPGEKWQSAIAACENMNTWPILIDESNKTMLSSPIILYDYPKLNAQSPGDLFDSTEIEEALLLHVSVLSDDEKKKIRQSDEKLDAMLNKVSQVTPEEFNKFHSGLKHSRKNQTDNKQNCL